jgi:hypothetical protein
VTKTEKALGAGLIVTAVALGATLLTAKARVIIVTDGSVRVHADEEDFPEVDATPGKKHKWPEKAKKVAVWACNEPQPAMKPFTKVVVNVVSDSSPVLGVQFQNEGGELAASFGDGYKIRWTGAWHQLESEGAMQDLEIGEVAVTNNGQAETFTFDGDTCIAFRNKD